MTRPFVWIAIASMACALAGAQAAPSGSSGSSPTGGLRIWIEPGPAQGGTETSMHVDCQRVQAADAPIVFKCELRSKYPIDDGVLRLEVKDSSGAVVHRAQTHIILDNEQGSRELAWDAQKAGSGVYTARFELVRAAGFSILRREYTVRKMAVDSVRAEFQDLQGRITQMAESLRDMEAQGIKPPYIRIRLAIANDYLAQVPDALDKGDWLRADSVLRFLRKTADTTLAHLALDKNIQELWESVPQPSLRSLAVRDGAFYAENRPVFLFGSSLDGTPAADEISRLGVCGLNLAAFPVGPDQTLAGPGEEQDFPAKLDPVFQRAGEKNVAVMIALDPRKVGAWAIEQAPAIKPEGADAVDLTHPAARQLVERHIHALVPYLAKQDRLAALSLLTRPEFKFTGEDVRRGFQEVVTAFYKDRQDVNRNWKSLFAKLDEIQIGWNHTSPRYQDSSAYRYDWRTYHQHLGAKYIQWMKDLAKADAPNVPLTIACADTAFNADDSETGVNREAIAPMLETAACCAANVQSSPFYALGYPRQVLTYTLMRSFAPDKPLVNFEDSLLEEDTFDSPCTYEYVYSAMWEAAIAGLNASALRKPAGFVRPECIEGYAVACADLNRLAPIAAAFQRAPADVAILWSMPSKIYANGSPYLKSTQSAFEGASFAGYKTRFITEKQCIDGQLGNIRVLVLPNTPAVDDETFPVLKDFMQGTGTVIRTASSILYDEHGRSRRDIISSNRRTILIRGQDEPTQYLHAMDAVAASGQLPSIPRTINKSGYPIEGVKSRYVEIDGQGYLYLVNLRKEPVVCNLYGGDRSGRDMIRGRDVRFPMQVSPLDPMLVRLDKPEPAPPTKKKHKKH